MEVKLTFIMYNRVLIMGCPAPIYRMENRLIGEYEVWSVVVM